MKIDGIYSSCWFVFCFIILHLIYYRNVFTIFCWKSHNKSWFKYLYQSLWIERKKVKVLFFNNSSNIFLRNGEKEHGIVKILYNNRGHTLVYQGYSALPNKNGKIMFDNWFWYDTIYMFVTSQYYVSNEGKGLGDGNIKSSKIFSILFNLTLQNTDNGTIIEYLRLATSSVP